MAGDRTESSSVWVQVERASFEAGFDGEWHSHARAQLIYPSRGVMALETGAGLWVVPTQQACWLPASEPHRVQTSAGFEMYSVYCDGTLLGRLPSRSGIVAVSGLLRETILALETATSRARRLNLALLLSHEIVLEKAPPLFVPQLSSKRLRVIEAALMAEPGNNRTLSQWASELATSSRSLARAFQSEARMTFTACRRQVRLRSALIRLAQGHPVTSIALDLSFGSTSSFIRTFRRATGLTPARYFSPRLGLRSQEC